MTYVEYWILDNALEYPLPFYHLASEFDEYQVRCLWHYDREKLLDGFEAVLERGEIAVHDGDSPIGSPSRIEINEFLESECFAYRDDGWVPPTYQLTEAGGRAWENVSKPNWDEYVSGGWPEWDDDLRGGVLVAAATSQRLIENYVRALQAHHPTSVVRGTESWDTIRPFHVTYWKELPMGERLTCRTIYERGKPLTGEERLKWWDSLRKWYTPPQSFK